MVVQSLVWVRCSLLDFPPRVPILHSCNTRHLFEGNLSPANSPTIIAFKSQEANLLISLAVDLGGSLAVASKGLFATGVSTDLNGCSQLLSKEDYLA